MGVPQGSPRMIRQKFPTAKETENLIRAKTVLSGMWPAFRWERGVDTALIDRQKKRKTMPRHAAMVAPGLFTLSELYG